MASPNPTTSFAQLTTYRLRSWNELYSVQTKRYFHYPVGSNRDAAVEVTRDNRVACRCNAYIQNLKLGLGPCEHVVEALDFVDAVGFHRLPSWPARKEARS